MHTSGETIHFCLKSFFPLAFLCVLSISEGYGQDATIMALEAEADTLMNREDYKGALKLYTRLVESSKEKESWFYNILYKRSVCYYSIEDYDNALKDVDIVVNEYTAFPQALLLRAFINRELDDADAQLKDLTGLLQLDPLNPDLLKWQASVLIQNDLYDEALVKLKLVRTLRNDHEVELHTGLAYYYLNDPDSALLHFDQSIDMNGQFLPAYFYAGSVCLEESAYELALTYLDKGLKIDREDPTLLFYKGVALVEMKQEKEGCRYLSKAFYSGVDDASGYLKEYCYQ